MNLYFVTAVVLLLNFPLCFAQSTSTHPPSDIQMEFDMSTLRNTAPGNGVSAPESDNWAVTWADDGNQYTVFGDGVGFSTSNDKRALLGVAKIIGGKNSYSAYDVFKAGSSDSLAGKSLGIISIGSKLYMFRNGNGSGGSAFNQTELYKSVNYGSSWEYTGVKWGESEFANSKGFYSPTFLQFGKGYANSRDDYVYIYANEENQSVSSSEEWNVQVPGEITLIRVNKYNMSNKSSYEYFAGTDNQGNPIWTSDVTKRKPAFSDSQNGIMRTSVSYNAGLDRYILITQQKNRWQSYDFHIGVYEADEPWGPWRTILFKNAKDAGPGLNTGAKTVYWNLSNKWLSADGKNFVMVYTGPGPDQFGTVEGSFYVSGGGDGGGGTLPDDSGTPPNNDFVNINYPTNYEIANLTVNDRYHIDRTYTVASVPQGFESATWIKTANDDKKNSSDSLLSFNINQDSDVYVAFDEQAFSVDGWSPPDWLSEYSPTNNIIHVNGSASRYFKLFVKTHSAGNVSIPGPRAAGSAGGISNYIVLLKPLGGSDPIPDNEEPPTDTNNEPLTVDLNWPSNYVLDQLKENEEFYIDRDYTVASIPSHMANMKWIKTANNDKTDTSDDMMSFDVNQTVSVYVAFDEQAFTQSDWAPPLWLNEFTEVNEIIDTNGSASDYMKLFVKTFPAGAVTLPGPRASGSLGKISNYFVVVCPDDGSAPPPDSGTPPPDDGTPPPDDGTTPPDDGGTTPPSSDNVFSLFIDSPADYVTASLSIGDKYYIDRSYAIASIPAGFENATWIKTANDDKTDSSDNMLTLDVNQEVEIFIAFDEQAFNENNWSPPDWIYSFTDTGLNIDVNGSASEYFKLFSGIFSPGIINLPGPRGPGYAGSISNYIVLVKPTSNDPDTIPQDDGTTPTPVPLELSINYPIYYVIDQLDVNDTFYIDRNYTIADMPTFLKSVPAIKTANDDKTNTTDDMLSFNVNQSVAVYVAFDKMAFTKNNWTPPDWLDDFTYTNDIIDVNGSGSGYLKLFVGHFDEGTISLPGPRAEGSDGKISNYIVFVKPMPNGVP